MKLLSTMKALSKKYSFNNDSDQDWKKAWITMSVIMGIGFVACFIPFRGAIMFGLGTIQFMSDMIAFLATFRLYYRYKVPIIGAIFLAQGSFVIFNIILLVAYGILLGGN